MTDFTSQDNANLIFMAFQTSSNYFLVVLVHMFLCNALFSLVCKFKAEESYLSENLQSNEGLETIVVKTSKSSGEIDFTQSHEKSRI
jgi:hypothetical protein